MVASKWALLTQEMGWYQDLMWLISQTGCIRTTATATVVKKVWTSKSSSRQIGPLTSPKSSTMTIHRRLSSQSTVSANKWPQSPQHYSKMVEEPPANRLNDKPCRYSRNTLNNRKVHTKLYTEKIFKESKINKETNLKQQMEETSSKLTNSLNLLFSIPSTWKRIHFLFKIKTNK